MIFQESSGLLMYIKMIVCKIGEEELQRRYDVDIGTSTSGRTATTLQYYARSISGSSYARDEAATRTNAGITNEHEL
jgi:hypothetical protein